jgi:hypothetical protein
MPSLTYQDLKLSIGMFSNKVHVQLRTLDIQLTEDEIAALLYPIFDAEEKALVIKVTTQGEIT